MKSLFLPLCLFTLILMQGCGGTKKHNDADQTSGNNSHSKVPVPPATNSMTIYTEKDLIGYWVGQFGQDSDKFFDDKQYNTINISIDQIKGSQVKGHTVIAGKVRFFKCIMVEIGSRYQFSFKGGSDEKGIGTYNFGILKGESVMTGRWDAGDENTAHAFKLTKNLFKYDPDTKLTNQPYVDFAKSKTVTEKVDDTTSYRQERYFSTSDDVKKYNASTEELSIEYLSKLKKADLLIIRNSIFARHGYTFKKPLLSFYFSQQPWYVPISSDVNKELTDIEKKNLELIKPYEKYAEEYYGAFGR